MRTSSMRCYGPVWHDSSIVPPQVSYASETAPASPWDSRSLGPWSRPNARGRAWPSAWMWCWPA